MATNESTVFEEGTIRFQFRPRWEVIKFDEHPAYRRGIEELDETKAVDFVGLLDDELYFIEVKDFRGYRIQTKQRVQGGELWIEIGQKVRDSLAGIVSAYRTSSIEPELWSNLFDALKDKEQLLKVVLWLEEDCLPHQEHRMQKSRLSTRTKELKRKFRWLTTKVLVCNIQNNPLPDLSVTNLPRRNTS